MQIMSVYGNGFNAAEELDPLFSVENRESGGLDRVEEAESHSVDSEHDLWPLSLNR